MSAITKSQFLTRLQQTSFRSQSNLNSITHYFGTLPTCFEIERPKSVTYGSKVGCFSEVTSAIACDTFMRIAPSVSDMA